VAIPSPRTGTLIPKYSTPRRKRIFYRLMAIRRTYRTGSSLWRFLHDPARRPSHRHHAGIATAPFARSANICRHRGRRGRPSSVPETARRLQCHYHGWTYNLDGSLRTAAARKRAAIVFPENSPSSLIAISRSKTWGPLIFVNPSPDAGRLHDLIGRTGAQSSRARGN